MTRLSDANPEKSAVTQDEAVENPSRRGFLNTAGISALSGLVLTAGGGLLVNRGANATTAPVAPALPWKYKALDPLEAGKRGYKFYLEKGG